MHTANTVKEACGLSTFSQARVNVWEVYADKALRGEVLTKDEAFHILGAPDEELLPLLQAAYRVRYHYYGNKVKLNMIINAKSGLCPEDCGYCSQSIVSKAPIEKYPLLDKETLIEGAREAVRRKAGTYCIVASGRGATDKEIEQVAEAVKAIKQEMPLKICCCLGIISEEQAQKLREAGVERYNHNLNTSASHYSHITTTHTYEDRVRTVQHVKQAGISPCSGCIIGMGETWDDVYHLALSLRELDADSIPVNFLHAIPGTPLENMDELNPRYCLKVLALFRFINPSKEIRISGGREVNLRSLQALGLYPANAIFVGDYLTTEGQTARADHQMIEDLGFEIELMHYSLNMSSNST
ncbi:biotin synthase BioB [Caldalkalibacillus thermarum TA2.A1]|uniref:Biotin synthase n=1 Tax=Caldalkalibacillus thermarum (strain TA2.A1) TaxID=986075 RepID=A0A8X8IA44_CALTT|nr:biotin synthase BioB [Caldalkalibacillus thermarum TA2.A1]